jgi:hypothetical protein
MQLDAHLNERHSLVISTPESHCIVRVVLTNEDLMVARHTRTLLFRPALAPNSSIMMPSVVPWIACMTTE